MTIEAATMSDHARDGFLNETDEFAFLLEEVPRHSINRLPVLAFLLRSGERWHI